MKSKLIKVPASHIPAGTVFGIASFHANRSYVVNTAEIFRGKATLVHAEGDKAFSAFITRVDSTGKKVLIFPTIPEPFFHLLTVATGAKIPIHKDLTKGLHNYAFRSLSPDGRYLSYWWTRKVNATSGQIPG
ncbi:MAG: hypothetical protein V4671_05035, partial [Armatimonadota bacterium]